MLKNSIIRVVNSSSCAYDGHLVELRARHATELARRRRRQTKKTTSGRTSMVHLPLRVAVFAVALVGDAMSSCISW